MTTKTPTWLALLGGLALGAASFAHASPAQDSAIIDTLVKKGIINEQEAKDLQAEVASQSSAGTLGISSSALTKLNLSGDARVRYEYRNGQDGGTGDTQERNRYRYRLRLGLTGELKDGWFFGTRLETSTSNRSTNVTTAGSATGPWDKSGNGIYLGQVYIGRHMGDFTVTAGRQPIPFVFSSMVLDDDLNPEGLSEQWKYKSGDVTWLANLGQFVYQDADRTNPFGGGANFENTYLFVVQGGVSVKLGGGTLQITPTYYGYSNSNGSATALTTPNSATLQTTGLQVIDIPVSYGFKLGGLPAKVFGDFAYNADAGARADAAGQSAYDGENIAYQIGFGLGEAKKPGQWEGKAFWQSVDAFALDSNLVDSDLFDGRTNMEGFVVQAAYVLSPGVSVKFTYANADRKNSALATYGAGDIGTANLTRFNLFQADLNVKF